MSDEDVIRLAGVALGDKLDARCRSPRSSIGSARAAASTRSRCGKRYRTLEMDEVALVLLVHERPGIRPDGTRPGPFQPLRQPADVPADLTYDDGYGWTYGGAHEHGRCAGARRATVGPADVGRHQARGARSGADVSRRTADARAGIVRHRAERESAFRRRRSADRGPRACGAAAVRHRDRLAPTSRIPISRSADRTITSGRPARTRRSIRGAIRRSRRMPCSLAPGGASCTSAARPTSIGISVDARGYKRSIGQSVTARSTPNTTPPTARCQPTSNGCSAAPTCAARAPERSPATSACSDPRNCACRSRRR